MFNYQTCDYRYKVQSSAIKWIFDLVQLVMLGTLVQKSCLVFFSFFGLFHIVYRKKP